MNTRAVDCESAIRLLAEYLDRELGDAESATVRAHLARCRSCYSRAEFERRLKASLSGLQNEAVRPALEWRIRKMIETFEPRSKE